MTASPADLRAITVEEIFPHAPATLWTVLTSGDLIGRWLMAPTGFAPEPGTRFTFQTKPGGAWDGVIHCQVLDVVPHERLSYSWVGGHPDNVGYGAPLDTVVTWTLTPSGEGTRLRLVHSGFIVPRNASALETMGQGWKTVVTRLAGLADTEV